MNTNDVWNDAYKSKQGNIGLGQAIAYYTSIGVPIMIPLNDTQKYDLVVDINNCLKRVSVKTTQFITNSGFYSCLLKNSGGGSGKSIIRNFDNTTCDIVVIYTKNGDLYEIPSEEIKVKTCLVLNNKWDEYKRGSFYQ